MKLFQSIMLTQALISAGSSKADTTFTFSNHIIATSLYEYFEVQNTNKYGAEDQFQVYLESNKGNVTFNVFYINLTANGISYQRMLLQPTEGYENKIGPSAITCSVSNCSFWFENMSNFYMVEDQAEKLFDHLDDLHKRYGNQVHSLLEKTRGTTTQPININLKLGTTKNYTYILRCSRKPSNYKSCQIASEYTR